MRYAFANLDKSRVPSGFLLDHAMEFTSLANFRGVLVDTNKTTAGLLKDIYNTLFLSAVHTNAGSFLHPDHLDTLWFRQRQAGVVVLSGVYYQYARFKDNAASSNLVSISNGQVRDRFVNGVWQNPYQSERVFALAAPIQRYRSQTLQVRLPANLWRTNQSSSISSIQADFADGLGYRALALGQTISLNYATAGVKNWKFKLSLSNGTILYSHTDFEIVANSPSAAAANGEKRFIDPAGPRFFTTTETYLGQPATGWITIDYANADLRLRRPLIVAEGFDSGHILSPEERFGDTDWESFRRQIIFSESPNLITLLQSNIQQYDIVYVDWGRGTDFIQRNALLLEAVIRWVNARKAQDNSTQPNVVLGQSMGGLVARYALRRMENNGQDHQTRLYISYDSPHQGANVPIAYQHLGRHAGSIYLRSNIPLLLTAYDNIRPIANFAIQLHNSIRAMFDLAPLGQLPAGPVGLIYGALTLADTPAARQMLINRVSWDNQIENSMRVAWQTELRNLGYPQGYVNRPLRNVAVSNGSECGLEQGFSSNANLLTLNGKINTRFLGDIVGMFGLPLMGAVFNAPQLLLGVQTGRNEFNAEFYCKAYPESQNTQIYKGRITYTKRLLWLIPITVTLTNRNYNASSGIFPFDNMQGGFYAVPINLNNTESQNWFIKYNIQFSNIPYFNFVPVTSALDIGRGNTNLTLANHRQRYVGALPPATPLNTPFVNFITAFNNGIQIGNLTNFNEPHIAITQRSGNWLANELNSIINNQANCLAGCPINTIITPQNGTNICNSGTYTFSVPAVAGATYNWLVGNGLQIVSGQGTTSVQVRALNGFNGNSSIGLSIGTNCGVVNVTPIPVRGGISNIVSTSVSPTPNYNNEICTEAFVQIFTNVEGASDYEWVVLTNNATVVNSEGSPVGYIQMPSTVGQIVRVEFRAINACGYNTRTFDFYTVSMMDGYYCPSGAALIAVSPNPASDELNLEMSDNPDNQALSNNFETEVKLINAYGELVHTQKTKLKKLKIDTRAFRKGLYYLQVIHPKGIETKRIVIEK
jgi:hypothetical protein